MDVAARARSLPRATGNAPFMSSSRRLGSAQSDVCLVCLVLTSCLFLIRGIQSGPGPGAYVLADPFRKDPVPQSLQFFGSTSRRLSENKQSRQLPGPGAYNDPRTAIKTQKRVALTDHGPFDSTSARFRDRADVAELPGPGAYEADPADNPLLRKPNGGFSSFASFTVLWLV